MKQTDQKTLSIIIPSYNTKQLLQNCLTSIFKQTKKIRFEVIVVDNGSKDDSVKMIAKEFPKVKLIKLGKNLGYGKANNLGAKKAKGDWFLFLNSDTFIKQNAISKMFKWIKGREVDIAGCKLQNKDGSIQQSAGFFPTLFRVFCMMAFIDDLPLFKKITLPYQQTNKKFYQKTHQVDWVTGAFLMIKKDLFEKIGGFDEDFFMYAEEIDLCFRAKKKQAKVWYTPKARVIHIKGGSSKHGFKAAVAGEFKGLIAFFKKHKKSWHLPALKTILFFGALLRILLFAIINPSKANAYWQAIKLTINNN